MGGNMANEEFDQNDSRIARRTALKAAGVAGVGISGLSGLAAAKGNGGGPGAGGPPCHKDFSCEYDGTYVKIEFVEDDEACYFEEETDTGLVEITDWEGKDGEECEPISVEWETNGYVVTKVMAFGGTDCASDSDEDGLDGFDEKLKNPAGQRAAISNLQFCLEEDDDPEIPECPIYGTSREDPTAIFSIQTDPDGDIVETQIGEITDESSDSNYPNGVAFDDENNVWYYAEDDGTFRSLTWVDEDEFEEVTWGTVTPNGEAVAGAAFWDETGEYLHIPNGTSELRAAEIVNGGLEIRHVVDLDWSGINLGDLAIDRDEQMLYVSTANTSVGSNFFSVDLENLEEQVEIVNSSDRDNYAVSSQIAFDDEGTMWAHNAGNGEWRIVEDLDTGELSDLVATTNEYTDLARCGFYPDNEPEE